MRRAQGISFHSAADFWLALLIITGKTRGSFMQASDATTIYLFKLWPWIETNKNKLIVGAGIIAVAICVVYFLSSQREQKEIDAGKALTQTMVSSGAIQPDVYLKIADEYPGTLAAQRALLQGATAFFAAGRFADAQAQFQKFLDTYPDNAFAAQATLGVAASLEAQGKLDLAAAAYQRTVNTADTMTIGVAKFAIARIDEQQGKSTEALNFYTDVARANPEGTLGSEAALRVMELKSKLPIAPAPASQTSPAPFTLTH
jgi:predicted negative regulator of RcsB-dependent stress response